MKTRKTHRTENLQSYLTDKSRRAQRTSIFHPQNRDDLMGACKTISCVLIFMTFIVLCFTLADIAEIITNYGKV